MRLAIARFPHATSAISTGCKLNIITSRYVHLSRVITVVANFQQEMARVMYDFSRRGYNMVHLWRKLRHVLRCRPVYHPTPWYVHHRAIWAFYEQAAMPPHPPPPMALQTAVQPAAPAAPLLSGLSGSDMDLATGY